MAIMLKVGTSYRVELIGEGKGRENNDRLARSGLSTDTDN